MSVDFIRWVQGRLNEHGYKTDVDGMAAAGFRTAVETFQRAYGLRATGTATNQTVEMLRKDPKTGKDAVRTQAEVRPVWLAEMERRLGLHETRNKKTLADWLRSDGRTLGDPEKLPWCGDAVQTALALTLPNEPQIANPYLARNWLKFGRACPPRLGAIMVFWRGSRKGTSGHVALYVGEDKETYHVSGGNQNNAITVTRVAKDRYLGSVWPLTDNTLTFVVQRTAQDPISTNEA